MKNAHNRVVIVGSGFGGMYAYLEFFRQQKKLPKELFDVILLSDNDRFEFTPLIHEVATGALSPPSVWQSIRSLKHVDPSTFVQGRVEKINLEKKIIFYDPVRSRDDKSSNEPLEELSFDYLILATGARTCFFGIEGAKANAYPLKSIEDAKQIRSVLINRFEEASGEDSNKKKRELLHFVVVGGGPTGVELAGEIADLAGKEMKKAFPALSEYVSITLLNSGERILKQVDPWFSKKAKKILERKGVKCRLGKRVTSIEQDKVVCDKIEEVPTGSVFWTAGVQAREIEIIPAHKVERDERSKRIKVNKYLHTDEFSDVYVVGDGAWVKDKETNQPYPMRAQFAVREGRVAVRNIVAKALDKEPEVFSWKDQGFIVSLGKGGALAEVFGMKLSGPLAWFMYRTAYFFKLPGARAKLRTGLEWFVNLFTPRDITEI